MLAEASLTSTDETERKVEAMSPQEENDRRAGPHSGVKTAFTAMLKVKPGHEQALRELIEHDHEHSAPTHGALKQIGTLHEFRWVLFDNDRRLLFTSAFDGDWEKYVQDFASTDVGIMIDRNLAHVEDWVGINDPGASEQLLRYGVPASQYATAYSEATVKQVWKALDVQKAFEQVLNDPDAAEALKHPALKPLLDQAAD